MCGMHYARFKRHGDPLYVPYKISRHPLYSAFHSMRNRCNIPTSRDYPMYGGRGIKVCDRWNVPGGFSNFLTDMGERPEGMTLDRINNDGDYTPENCHWATKQEQVINRRTQKNNVSGQRGVRWDYTSNRWVASIHLNGKGKYLGSSKVKSIAIKHRLDGEVRYWGRVIS